ncbi:FadR/GntR family transcriptional regulator [Dactylosporangium aurantiacum]|uniref:FadR/GntR family transcriptional regulator n=1 Tax=Dactylosporangium aurantiacum TaxID=35754 RepID=UPI001FDEA63B|nr:FadR/GntR family transcriptional regulator [Dactylosporangium aurantiacum]MDG6105738.1 FadR/GntR family transcriptional regulator [Dactylosporangium aurantiacum]
MGGSPPPGWVRGPASLAKALTAELVERIVRGTHEPGSALPPEPVLCETYSVSRTVVRESVKILQEKGLVQVRQGSGTVVNPPAMWDLLDELVLGAAIAVDEDLTVLDDVVVTRRILESDMAHVAARLADAQAVERIGALVERMDEVVEDVDAFHEHDAAFHDAIMQASGNRIARAVVRSLQHQVVNIDRYIGHTDRALREAANSGHRRVYERIAAHDAQGAQQAMFAHITDAWLVRRSGSAHPDRLRR